MAIKPKIVTLTNSSVDVLNVIRNNASVEYRNHIPVATNNPESIREIGAILMDYTALQNEFLNVLVNRIGLVLIKSKLYENPIRMFKKGVLEMGETVEEVFTNLIKAQDFDPKVASEELFKRELPDVRSAFHTMNYQKFYKVTVSEDQLKQAFLTMSGVYNLTTKIIEEMYTSANYDEFITMKYMLAKNILNGRLTPVAVGQNPEVSPKYVVTEVKAMSNNFEFLNSKYNVAGVYNHTLKNDQYVLINSRFSAIMDVEVLASAFNMNKTEFMGHVILIDGFGELDTPRLDELFENDKTYSHLSTAETEALNKIPVVLVDGDYFMVYDNLIVTKSTENGQGLYWNYFLHTWKTFSVSPFAQACVFVPLASTDIGVSEVTITPSSVTVNADFEGTIPLSAKVETTGYVTKAVKWEIEFPEDIPDGLSVTVNAGGSVNIVHTGDTTEFNYEITVKASSIYDDNESDKATITIGTPT